MEANVITRHQGFQPGNKLSTGQPKGSRNSAQLLLQQIGQDNVEKVFEVMIDKALNGDFEAGTYILDKILPNARGTYVNLPLPHVDTFQKVADAQDIIVQHLANGEITADEAVKIFNRVESRRKSIELVEYEDTFNQLASQAFT